MENQENNYSMFLEDCGVNKHMPSMIGGKNHLMLYQDGTNVCIVQIEDRGLQNSSRLLNIEGYDWESIRICAWV